MTNIDLKRLIPADEIIGEDAKETELLKAMLHDATDYLRSFQWCPPIDSIYLGCGIGGVVAVFLVHFTKPVKGTDEWLWVINGDLPTAYLVTDQAHDPASALEIYCELMDEWVKAILEGLALDNVFPVDAEPTHENAKNLIKRLGFIRKKYCQIGKLDGPT